MKKFIAYYRVSTKKQNIGLDAQRTIVEQYISVNGGVIVGEYSEKESGTHDDRPALNRALIECGKQGATLIVAKVDRLTRDLAFGATLCKTHAIEFCDHPHMTVLEQGIFFAMAQQEREYISQRTKQALAEKKKQGVKLGNPYMDEEHWNKCTRLMGDANREKANKNTANIKAYAVIKLMNGTLQSKADYLNGNGFPTPSGKEWSPTQVARLIKRYITE